MIALVHNVQERCFSVLLIVKRCSAYTVSRQLKMCLLPISFCSWISWWYLSSYLYGLTCPPYNHAELCSRKISARTGCVSSLLGFPWIELRSSDRHHRRTVWGRHCRMWSQSFERNQRKGTLELVATATPRHHQDGCMGRRNSTGNDRYIEKRLWKHHIIKQSRTHTIHRCHGIRCTRNGRTQCQLAKHSGRPPTTCNDMEVTWVPSNPPKSHWGAQIKVAVTACLYFVNSFFFQNTRLVSKRHCGLSCRINSYTICKNRPRIPMRIQMSVYKLIRMGAEYC